MMWYAPIHAIFCNISWFPSCTARYGEIHQKTLELFIYFMEGIETLTECVC